MANQKRGKKQPSFHTRRTTAQQITTPTTTTTARERETERDRDRDRDRDFVEEEDKKAQDLRERSDA